MEYQGYKMSKGTGYIMLDKYLAQEFKDIRREFSIIEAMFSYTLDKDNGKNGSISGYSKLWGWSRWRVRKFIETIHSTTGHYPDRRQTHSRHPIHFIDKALWDKTDSIPTVSQQLPNTTTNPNPKPKELYTSNFVSFWEKYPRKIGKGSAFKSYKNIKEPRPSLQIILNAIEAQNKTDQWKDKQFIPHPTSWINQRRWEDELEPVNGTVPEVKNQEQIDQIRRDALL